MSFPKRLTLEELRKLLYEVRFLPDNTRSGREAMRSMSVNAMTALDRDPQVFDFGNTAGLQIDQSMAATLWNKKLLRLPFPVSIFTFKPNEARITILAMQDVEIGVGDQLESGLTGFFIVSQSGEWVRRPDAFVWFDVPNGDHVKLGASVLTPCSGETDESFQSYCLQCVAKVMQLSLLLNTKGIVKRFEPAPAKLNAKRARSGKPPLDSVTYVDLNHLNFGGSGEGKGGERSMHFRRGHIRHYNDGSVTWVRDTIVKADGELKKRERYQIKGN